jgi:tetratricopeptide (TPR) repeat protein
LKLPTPPIYISYAWGQSAESEEEKVVNSLCDKLASLGYKYVRDRNYLKYLDDLPNFLKRIGSGGYVIAIIGDKYLHSENCMIEASYMAQKGSLGIRVFPVTLSSLKGIYKIESRTKLIDEISEYWKDKENDIKELLDKLRYTQGFISLRKDLSLVTQLTNYLSEFIRHIGTTLQISAQEHLDENFTRLIESLNTRMDSDSKEFKESMGFPDLGQPYYKRFSSEYIGRKESINDVLNFLNDLEKHFMLLYGVGGMGKSHLIDISRRAYDNPFLLHEECTINYNLKSLFKTCKITYPENLDTTEERQNYFLKEFCERDIYLILDDFYETVDFEIRNMLPKIAGIPSGKILLVSRAIPKELESIGFHFDKYFIPPLNETDFNTVIKNYIIIEKKELELSPSQLHKIYEKTQGYPLGGQLLVDLLFLGEGLDEILADLPKFEAELDEEGKKFSGRLLDNIFRKGNPREITLLCQFSALFGASHKGLIRQLPAFNQTAFDALVNRRKFIWKDDSDLFNSHAMIKDYAYDKLGDKAAIHQHLGKYFEGKLFANPSLDSTILESAIQHYKRVSLFELKKFGQRVDWIFNISNVKSLIEIDVKDTIKNYNNLLDVYPEKIAYYNELGIAYRLNNQLQQAIETFLKLLKVKKDDVKAHNELGITYRESGKPQLAIETFLKAIEIDPKHLPSYNELGITYRESGKPQQAIETFLKAIEIDPKQLPSYNELGITYREAGLIQTSINFCEKHLQKHPENQHCLLTLLQTYVYFEINIEKAKVCYDILFNKNKYADKNKDNYKREINRLRAIWSLELPEITNYRNYINRAINYKAYMTILPLLFNLNKKFPNDSKILSRLGKTLCNKQIGKANEGRVYIKEAIELFKKENNLKNYYDFVFYYLYGLLNENNYEVLETEIAIYKKDIKHLSKYHRFLAWGKETSNESIDKIISEYETAIIISETIGEKLKSIESFLDYLFRIDSVEYESKIKDLKLIRDELYKEIDKEDTKPSR